MFGFITRVDKIIWPPRDGSRLKPFNRSDEELNFETLSALLSFYCCRIGRSKGRWR